MIKREDMTDVFRVVLQNVSQYNPRFPNRPLQHVAIVKECTRFLNVDEPWQAVFKKDKGLVRMFCLDPLFTAPEPAVRKIAEQMGCMLVVKVPGLDMSDIVEDDYSMQKISQAITKLLIVSN